MGKRNLFFSFIGALLVLSILAGCGAPADTPPVTSTPSATPVPPTATPTPPPPEHRIAVRVVDGVGEFYDRFTGEKFIPRGNNYIRLARQQSFSGGTFTYHSTFNVNLYDPQEAEEVLGKMQADGYNIVRVFIQGSCANDCIGDSAGGLNKAYIANVVDFLHRVKAHSIFVILTTDSEPGTSYYISLLDTTWSESFGGTNSQILRGGGVLVGIEFWQDLVEELLAQEAPLDAIFAYALRNELFFESNAPPFSLSSGIVSTANGKTYDMALEQDRQRMMEEGLVYWIDNIRRAILERDPTALVTVGFFVPQTPNPLRQGDPRLAVTAPAIWESQADFIDLHPYPGFGTTLEQYVENFGMQGMLEKPILMGEFGAARSSYSSTASAARALHDWQVQSCEYGFDGWLMWTWDLNPDEAFYTALDGSGEIRQALAPVNRPDPCQVGDFDFFEFNLALGMPVTASRSLPDQQPGGAVDGDTGRWWGAGAPPPQWIQIDLGQPSTIGTVRLVISQSPNGATLHELWGGPSTDQLILLHTFEGTTFDDQVLEFKPDIPLEDIRFIRVKTRKSPSWVSWKEIELLAP